MCGEKDDFRKSDVQIAPLQICTHARYIKKMERAGHFHYRNDTTPFNHETHTNNISHTQLFAAAKRVATRMSSKCSTKEAKEQYILSHGNIVFIAGEAGIGKSTFCKRLVQEMLDEKQPLYGAKIIFFIKFRDLNYKKEIDLLQLLTTGGSSIFHNYSSEERRKILKIIEDQGDDVCIVMDGLDEAIINNTISRPICNIHSNAIPEIFIKNLADGNILPKSRLIITSRPRQLTKLTDDYYAYFIVNILGLSKIGQEKICRDICGKDVARIRKILDYINNRNDIRAYCYVPINCILIMRSFNDMSEKEWSNVHSLTAIMVNVLCVWFLKTLKDEFQTKEIAELAYQGFIQDRYYFDEWDLKENAINFRNLTTFLTNTFKLLDGTEITSYFIHLIWQEFFVALRLRIYTSIKELKSILSRLESDKYEVVTKFLFGLCNARTLRKLLGYIKRQEINSSADRKECETILKNFALAKMQTHNTIYYTLPFLEWFYECNDEHFTRSAADLLSNDLSTNSISFLPNDATNLHHILRARERNLSLYIGGQTMDNCFTEFYRELSITLQLNKYIHVSLAQNKVLIHN